MSELLCLPGANQDADNNIKDIYNYIINHSGNCYGDVIKEDFRPGVFEALTDRRAAEFGWYDFERGSKVLELGAGWGECTGVLALKCGNVVAVEENFHKAQAISKRHEDKDNLAVYAGDWRCLKGEGLYDYVVFHDVEAYLSEERDEMLGGLLEELCSFLKSDGLLLMNIANRYAMKHWCGESRCLLQPEFPCLSEGAGRHGFSKREIEREISSIEGISCKFYYPMYDRHKPQQIFTDAHLPERENLKEMELYRRGKNVMLNDEREMYISVIEEGVYPLFAEAFFVECARDNKKLSKINYAKISADRPRRLAMATVLMEDKAAKVALFEEGIAHLQDMLTYQKDLQNHGVSVLPVEYDGSRLFMPFVKKERLGQYLSRLAETDKLAFIACLDSLYDLICRSSEHVSAEESPFCMEAELADWDPILKRAYLELIDLNCFYDGNFLFYDQEYMREAMPAQYIMYRELLNLYYAHPELENHVKETDMLARFGITGVILEAVKKEEFENFLAGLVDREVYSRMMQPHGYEFTKQHEARREAYLFAGCANKILAVIGCGARFMRYMSQYGKRYAPDILVDNNSERWGGESCGVLVSPPQKLAESDPEILHIIICVKDYEPIEAQLLEMKLYDYRIF